MHLKDMKAHRAGKLTSYSSPLADELGNRHFELRCSGPTAMVRRAMAKADLQFRIRPHARQTELQKELPETWPDAYKGLAPLALDPFGKKPKSAPARPTAANSTVLALSRTEGKRTVFFFGLFGIALARGTNFFLAAPPACNTFAMVTPLAGDADVFLSLNSPFAPPVAASRRGGMAVDAISFGAPFCFPPFVPFVRVNAFTTTVFNVSVYTFSVP